MFVVNRNHAMSYVVIGEQKQLIMVEGKPMLKPTNLR